MNNDRSLKSILLLTANPKNTANLRLQEEEREIKERLRLAGYGKVPINSVVAVRPRDIQQALLDFRPQVVHFSGHGADQNGLVFEDNAGKAKLIDSDALAQLFELFANQVECVVLNACYSVVQAQAIAKHIKYVVGMNDSIGDHAAIVFSVGFYTALGAGENFEFAYRMGCVSIRLEGIQEHLTPEFLKRDLQGSDSLRQFNSGIYSEEVHDKNSLPESNLENRKLGYKKYHRFPFNVGSSGEIRIIGPRSSGKTTFLAALADWHDIGFRKPIKAVEPMNYEALSLKELATNILKTGDRLAATDFYFPQYLFGIETKPSLWQNPICWLLKRNIRFSVACQDYPGELINALKSPSDHCFMNDFLDDCAFASGFLIMIDGTDSIDLDRDYAQAFLSLRRELISRIKRGNWKVKYRIAIVFSKADQSGIWEYRSKLKEFTNKNFPYTQKIFKEWCNDDFCPVSVAYFACSAFGMRGDPAQPNSRDDFSTGKCGCIADPSVWQPFGLAAPIYWLATGRNDRRLQ
jgi:CHAT domain